MGGENKVIGSPCSPRGRGDDASGGRESGDRFGLVHVTPPTFLL